MLDGKRETEDGQGSRWRFCAECGKPILVNVGSVEDVDEVLCQACAGMYATVYPASARFGVATFAQPG